MPIVGGRAKHRKKRLRIRTDGSGAGKRTVFGEDRAVETKDPLMGSEDFSYVLQNAPGAFYFVQVSPPEIDPQTAAFNHSPHVLFDDAHLADQAASLAALAFARTIRDV